MDLVTKRVVADVVAALVVSGARKATKYLSEKETIKASRPAYKDDKKRGRFRRGLSRTDIVLTIGGPNYEERKFIKACKRAGESFPVKKIQLRFLPGFVARGG